MFQRRNTAVHQRNVAAACKLATVSAVLALLPMPASAAPSIQVPCSETLEATLHIADGMLVTDVVNLEALSKVTVSSSTIILAPRAEAAIRDAFATSRDEALTPTQPELAKAVLASPMAGRDATPEPDSESEERAMPDTNMNPKLPGISDDDLLRYKKQMYRRDI